MKKASIGRYILLSQIYVLITIVIVPYMLSGKKIAVIDNTVNDAKSITVSAEENETPSKEYKVGDMDIEEYIKGACRRNAGFVSAGGIEGTGGCGKNLCGKNH